MAGRELDDLPVRTYLRSECTTFRKTAERFGGLSNMAPGFPLSINGTRLLTTEALYQACRFPHDPALQQIIIEQASPMTAKMKSKPYRSRSRPDWDDVRVEIMRWCLRVKLAQNWASFGALLESTGESPIVEESRRDRYWGAVLDESRTQLVGRNVLGRLLMEVRAQLREQGQVLCEVEPPKISEMLFLGGRIEAIKAADHSPRGEALRLFDPAPPHAGWGDVA